MRRTRRGGAEDTPLYKAVDTYPVNVDVIKGLVEKGANVNERDEKTGNTPLHMASQRGYTDVVEYLLSKGADVDAKNKDDETPLHRVALASGKSDIIKLLLRKGADPNAKNKNGSTPLFVPSERGWGPYKDAVLALLEDKRTDVNVKDNNGITPLHLASSGTTLDRRYPEMTREPENHVIIVKALVEKGADINAQGGVARNTPLHWAGLNDRADIASYLLTRPGRDISLKNLKGKTATDVALPAVQSAIKKVQLTTIEQGRQEIPKDVIGQVGKFLQGRGKTRARRPRKSKRRQTRRRR